MRAEVNAERIVLVGKPLDFIARLAGLVPPPRVHLTRFHRVFAAHAALRAAITPGGRGAGARTRAVAPKPQIDRFRIADGRIAEHWNAAVKPGTVVEELGAECAAPAE